MPGSKLIPYRIRIGVTGHRKLDDPAAMLTLVKRAIDAEVENLFPPDSRQNIERVRRAGSTAISYRVLSPLAEGADRVVARAVLDYPGARLDAVLPLTVEDYLEDFETEESKNEFRSLLAKSRRPVPLRTRNVRDDRHDPGDQAELRRDAYAHVGQYVVDHCDVLIAVWDREPARGRGGTAEIVQYALDQNRPVLRVWGDGFEVLSRGNGLDASALDAIDRFNCYTIPHGELDKYVRNVRSEHFEKPKTAGDIPAGAKEMVERSLFPWYVRASLAAKENQKRFYRAGKTIYAFSAAAVGCAAVGVLFPALAGVGYGTELVLLLAIVLTFRQAGRTHAHQSWIENRFLAERIRCGIFMAICGVEPRPLEVLPFMGHSQTVNDWTVRVFDEIWDRLPRLSRNSARPGRTADPGAVSETLTAAERAARALSGNSARPDRTADPGIVAEMFDAAGRAARALGGCSQGECLVLNAYVREAWIGEQIEFHKGKQVRERRARKKLLKAGRIVLPATLAAATLHLLLLWLGKGVPEGSVELVEWAHKGLAFIALLFPAVAASLAGMEAHREHKRLEKRSANMGPQLERLNRQMGSAMDPARFERIVQELDELMLRETQDWLMLMRYVEIKAS